MKQKADSVHKAREKEEPPHDEALRSRVPRSSHGVWKASPSRSDPVSILQAGDAQRLPELVPIRYGRMLQSPFAFYRGAAAIMAADLADSPSIGVKVQACGDCHLMNFGGFATPERNIIFDINDFDETLPAPWEWDIKRLAASFVLAVRENGLGNDAALKAAVSCGRNYRRRMRDFAHMHPLDLWYARFDSDAFLDSIDDVSVRARVEHRIAKATASRSSDLAFPKLARMTHGEARISDAPPLIFHPQGAQSDEFRGIVDSFLEGYRQSVSEDRRALLNRYEYVDAAIKVVGIGSVGTRCWIILLMSSSNEPLFLQFKEAKASVLEPYAGKSAYEHHGQRIVVGQRLMQGASDALLGWTTGPAGQFYVRQLRDAKINPRIETFGSEMFETYAKACAWNLARAHAKTGDAHTIAAYLGKGHEFDEALGKFALSYADQAERDHAALRTAVKSGRVPVYTN